MTLQFFITRFIYFIIIIIIIIIIKVSLYKFTHISLLKNNGQLKQKNDKQPKKRKRKGDHPNLLKNKNHI